MSAESVLIFLSLTVVLAYVLDILSSRTRVPPIIFMLLAGIAIRFAENRTALSLPHVDRILPALGTVGLILIVLDAGLDLDIDRQKFPVIRSSFLSAFWGMSLTLLALAAFFHLFMACDLRTAFINAVPFSIISSAIAIPGARHLAGHQREFVTYESSFSDILGILVFNLLVLNTAYGLGTLLSFSFELLATTVVSVIFALALTALIGRIRHKIKYLPIFSVLVLAYAVAKKMHFSPLILVLVFGIMLNNFHLVIRGNMRFYLNPEELHSGVRAFSNIISEVTFVVKIFFFLLLGYSVNLSALAGYRLVALTVLPVLLIIYLFRYPALYLFRQDAARKLLPYAPRGLITILLFMSIPAESRIASIGDGLMVWLILATSAVMTLGGVMDGRRGDPDPLHPAAVREPADFPGDKA